MVRPHINEAKLIEAAALEDDLNAIERNELAQLRSRALGFMGRHSWCVRIEKVRLGMHYPGIVAIFLVDIVPARDDIDELIWVIVGDLPSAYISGPDLPNAACALDGYVGAMSKWVNAVRDGMSVAELIPMNVEPTTEHANMLASRLDFLNERILTLHEGDLAE